MPYKNKNKQRAYQRKYNALRRKEEISMRGGTCIKCASTEHLEFHHRDRSTKVDHKIWSWSKKRITKELSKCDLLYRECHLKETAKERSWYTSPHGSLTSYKNYGCRCQDCRRANAEYEHAMRTGTHVEG